MSIGSSSWVYFPKPSIVIYRFLDVIKSRNQLVFELIAYVEKNLFGFLREYWNSVELAALIEQLRVESYYDSCENEDAPVIFRDSQAIYAIQDSIVLYVLWKCLKFRECLDVGHDSPALKTLIHYVMLDGLVTNRFEISIESSYVQTFEYIAKLSIPQYVLSTVVHKLYDNNRLLAFTNQGNVSNYFDYFDNGIDTRTKETYVNIAKQFNLPPSSILFVAFSNTECKKAARAGFMVAKIRESNQKPPKYYTIRIIDEINSIRLVENPLETVSNSSNSAVRRSSDEKSSSSNKTKRKSQSKNR